MKRSRKNAGSSLLAFSLVGLMSVAISGGPDYGNGSGVAVTGTYAGVLVPIPTVLNPGPPPVVSSDNSLALFTVKIPTSGLANGTTAVFRNGLYYAGTITGSADPDSAKLTAVVESSFKERVPCTASETDVFTYNGNGQFVSARIVANPNLFSTAATRIRGRASITYRTDAPDPNEQACSPCQFSTTCSGNSDPAGSSGGPILYKISGFKQSSSAF